MTDDNKTQIESIDEIEAGDTLTVVRKGETVADEIEVTEVQTCGFSGVSEPQTDDEIDFGSSLHDLLTEALGSNSQFAHHFEVHKISGVEA